MRKLLLCDRKCVSLAYSEVEEMLSSEHVSITCTQTNLEGLETINSAKVKVCHASGGTAETHLLVRGATSVSF